MIGLPSSHGRRLGRRTQGSPRFPQLFLRQVDDGRFHPPDPSSETEKVPGQERPLLAPFPRGFSFLIARLRPSK